MAGIRAHWVWMGSKRGLERKRKWRFCAGGGKDSGGEQGRVGAPGGAHPGPVMVEKGGDMVIPWHRSAAPGVSDGSYPDTCPEPSAAASGQPKVGTREGCLPALTQPGGPVAPASAGCADGGGQLRARRRSILFPVIPPALRRCGLLLRLDTAVWHFRASAGRPNPTARP